MKNKIEEFVGKVATVKLGGLVVDVEVIDVKNSYGRDRYLISPLEGEGEIWVETITIKNPYDLGEDFTFLRYPDTIKGPDFPHSYPYALGDAITEDKIKKPTKRGLEVDSK